MCPECGASFPSPLKLSVHMATVHDSSQTSVVCDQCGKWFPHPNKLMRHKYSHHNNKKLLECHACDKVRFGGDEYKSFIKYLATGRVVSSTLTLAFEQVSSEK